MKVVDISCVAQTFAQIRLGSRFFLFFFIRHAFRFFNLQNYLGLVPGFSTTYIYIP